MLSVASRFLAFIIAAPLLAGCEAIAIAALGGGTSAGVSAGITHTIGGTVSRTYSAPLPRVRTAAQDALKFMHIDARPADKIEGGEEIAAHSKNRSIDIELEEISRNVTRMSVTVKSGAFMTDRATGAEILLQTDREMRRP